MPFGLLGWTDHAVRLISFTTGKVFTPAIEDIIQTWIRMMSAPASASAIATACPMPLVPPVTRAVCPSRENIAIVVLLAMTVSVLDINSVRKATTEFFFNATFRSELGVFF